MCRNYELDYATWHDGFCGKVLIASERQRRNGDAMATGYMHARDAAAEALMLLVAVFGAEYVLNEFFEYMDIDRQAELLHDFIRYNDVDRSEMNDDTLRTIEEQYKRAFLREWRKQARATTNTR